MLTTRSRGRRPDPVAPQPHPWLATGGGARVVVENEDAVWRWAAKGALERAGYQVACCAGPRHLPDQRCPLVDADRCHLLDGADVVVNALGISDPANRAVLHAVRTRRTQLPVIVEIPTPQLEALHQDIPGCRNIAYPARPMELIAAVDAAVRDNVQA